MEASGVGRFPRPLEVEVEVLFVAFSSFYPFWCSHLPSGWIWEGLEQAVAGTRFLKKITLWKKN